MSCNDVGLSIQNATKELEGLETIINDRIFIYLDSRYTPTVVIRRSLRSDTFSMKHLYNLRDTQWIGFHQQIHIDNIMYTPSATLEYGFQYLPPTLHLDNLHLLLNPHHTNLCQPLVIINITVP